MYKFDLFIIGTGATGSNLLPSLSQYAMSQPAINSITLIDGDIVEAKNARNQKFTKKDFGKNKAEVLARRFGRLGIDISYLDKFLIDKSDLLNLIDSENNGYSKVIPLIISCVDNNKARIILNDVFNDLSSCIYIDVGNGDDTDRTGQLVIGIKNNSKVITAPVCDYFPQILEGDKPVIESFSCAGQIVDKPQCIAVNCFSSVLVFGVICNLISYEKLSSSFITFNADTLEVKPRNKVDFDLSF